MKFSLLALIAFFCYTKTLFAEENCTRLKRELSVAFSQSSIEVDAGKEIAFVSNLSLSDSSLLSGWSDVSVQVWLTNGISGSKSLQHFLSVKESESIQLADHEITDVIPANFIGRYFARSSVFARGGTNPFCAGNLETVQEISIDVKNDPRNADIQPPRIENVQTNKTEYLQGELVEVVFTASDSNAICTIDQKEASLCDTVWHVELTNMESQRSLNFSAPVFSKSNDLYKVEFYLPADTAAGSYAVTIINVDDIYGNGSAQLLNPPVFIVSDQHQLKSKVEEILAPLLDDNQPPTQRYMGAVIGVVQYDKSFVFGLGKISSENSEYPGAENLFEIGSITKVFTSLALARAVTEGHLRLDDIASSILPDTAFPSFESNSITLRHLATHSASLERIPPNLTPANPLDPYKGYKVNQLKSYLESLTLSRKPGTAWEYSNTGTGVLGYILASRENMTFDSLIKRNVTFPLDMYDTGIELTPQQAYKFVPGHNWEGNITPHWTADGDDVLAGCGLLRSTPQDMLKFARANLKPETNGLSEVLKHSQIRHFNHGPYQGSSMGLGWVINDSDELLFHDGGTYGFQSLLLVDRRNNIAVLVLTNSLLFDATGSSIDNRPTEAGFQILQYLRAHN